MSIQPAAATGETLAGVTGGKPPRVVHSMRVKRAYLINNNAQVTPSHRALSAIVADALTKSAVRKSVTRTEWEVYGTCSTPPYVELHARPEQRTKGYTYNPGEKTPVTLTLGVPCRRCPNCLAWRAHMWELRAQLEIAQASRTWLGTLTLNTYYQEYCRNLARLYEQKNGSTYEALSEAEQFAQRHRFASKELTDWFKRLRKAGHEFKYLLATEAHRSGDPHYHVLIHEMGAPIRHKTLKDSWHWGFSDFHLIEQSDFIETARYVCKYLTKSHMARIRASIGYGQISLAGKSAGDRGSTRQA